MRQVRKDPAVKAALAVVRSLDRAWKAEEKRHEARVAAIEAAEVAAAQALEIAATPFASQFIRQSFAENGDLPAVVAASPSDLSAALCGNEECCRTGTASAAALIERVRVYRRGLELGIEMGKAIERRSPTKFLPIPVVQAS